MCVCLFDVDVRVQSGDVKLLCELYVECGKWQEAFKVADSSPELLKMVHAQHAAHLVHHDRFEDAMQVLHALVSSARVSNSVGTALLVAKPIAVITLPQPPHVLQALLESGQSEDTTRMLAQLLECAVLEQVRSPRRRCWHRRHASPSASPMPPTSTSFSSAARWRLVLRQNRQRSN